MSGYRLKRGVSVDGEDWLAVQRPTAVLSGSKLRSVERAW